MESQLDARTRLPIPKKQRYRVVEESMRRR